MYKLSEDKDIKIKAVERVMKESAVDCLNNRARNIRLDVDTNGSRACDYEKCDYECRFVDEEVLDELNPITDTNNLYYADGDVEYIISKLREVFYENDSVDLQDILSLFYDKTTFVVLRALKKIIDENIPIKTKTLNNAFLRENKNLYFLVSNIEYPSSFLLSGYASLPVFKIHNNLRDVIQTKEPEMIAKNIEEIEKLDYNDERSRTKLFYIFRKLFSNETREMFLEQFYIAKVNNIQKNKELRKKFLAFYGKYLLEIDDIVISFYNYRVGGALRFYKDGVWSDADDEIVEKFEEERKEQRQHLDSNKYGYYGILAENVNDDELMSSEIGIFKYKIFAFPVKSKTAESTGKVDKRIYREFNPGTNCGTGKFHKQGLITMMSSIFIKLLKANKPLPEVPLLGSVKSKKSQKDIKSNKFYEHLHQDAKNYLDEVEVSDKTVETFNNLMDTTKDALCSLSKEWFEKNNLLWVI